MSKGCVLDLKMRDKQGSVVTDYSRYGNDGAVNGGVEWAENGMRFDGSTGYLDCGNDESLDITDKLTVCNWVQLSLLQYSHFVCKDNAYKITYFSASNQWQGGVYGDVSGWKAITYTNVPVLEEWNYIIFTYDSSLPTDNLKIYINGVMVGSSNFQESIVISADDLLIGSRDLTPQQMSNASIDDVRIYNYALSLREIKAMYNAEKHKYI